MNWEFFLCFLLTLAILEAHLWPHCFTLHQLYRYTNSGGNMEKIQVETGMKTKNSDGKQKKKLGMLQVKAPFEGEISTVGSQNSK